MFVGRPLSGRLTIVLLVALAATALLRARPATAQSAGTLHTLTAADNGTTVTVTVGDRVAVQLDPSISWNVQVDNSAVLQRASGATVVGEQAAFVAVAPGRAVIDASGGLICAPGHACPAIAAVWSATIVVTDAGGDQTTPPAQATTHTLTDADNGATVNAAVGDTIVLKLDPTLNWTVSVDNMAIFFRPPVALAQGVQADWEVVAPGQATITATGDPPCRQATPPCSAPSQSWSATVVVGGAVHVLTQADNGKTVGVQLGDYVRLDAGTLQAQNATSSDPTVLQPVSIAFYHAPLFEAVAAGQATLSATLNPACYPQCLIASLQFSATIVVSPPSTPAGPRLSVAAGWNLIGVTQGTQLSVDAYQWQPAMQQYADIPAGTPLQGGVGYWAYFPAATTLFPNPGGAQSLSVQAAPGAWLLIGNPNGLTAATVGGADAVYTWDPVAGRYTQTTTLQPGQGAWAFSSAGGTITVTPAQ